MINDVENIHDFKINQLLDSTINLSLIYLAGLLLCAGAIWLKSHAGVDRRMKFQKSALPMLPDDLVIVHNDRLPHDRFSPFVGQPAFWIQINWVFLSCIFPACADAVEEPSGEDGDGEGH